MQQFKNMNFNITNEFNFTYCSLDEVVQLVKNLDVTSSPGISGIPVKIFKYSINTLAPLLVHLFNACIDTYMLPNEWKCGIVIPLYKNKGDNMDLNNYRGISILPPKAKVFERIIAKQITNYFITNELFYKGQHGFRKNHSCETAVHELMTDCYKNLEKKLTTLLLFIDFRKAFDLVDRELLLLKLGNYGFSNNALKLIKDYLSNRKQFVKIDGLLSIGLIIVLAVPQGSVLGPLLFLIFINDLPYYLNKFLTKMFADDTTIYMSYDDVDKLIIMFKIEINKLLE